MVLHVAGVSVGRWLPIVMIVVHVHMHVLVFFHSDIRFYVLQLCVLIVVKLPNISPEDLHNPGRDLQDYGMVICSHFAASAGHTSAALLPGRSP